MKDEPIIVLYIHPANHKAKTNGITTLIINSKTAKTKTAEKGSIKIIDNKGWFNINFFILNITYCFKLYSMLIIMTECQ